MSELCIGFFQIVDCHCMIILELRHFSFSLLKLLFEDGIFLFQPLFLLECEFKLRLILTSGLLSSAGIDW